MDKVPTAKDDPITTAIVELELMADGLKEYAQDDDISDIVDLQYGLIRAQLDRLRRIENFDWSKILGYHGKLVVMEISDGSK